MTKKTILTVATVALLAACTGKDPNATSIIGEIKEPLAAPQFVLISYTTHVDTIPVNDRHFTYERTTETHELATFSYHADKAAEANFVMEPGEISIVVSDGERRPKVEIAGTPANNVITEYNVYAQKVNEDLTARTQELQGMEDATERMIEETKLSEEAFQKRMDRAEEIYQENLDNPLGAYMFEVFGYSLQPDDFVEKYEAGSSYVKASPKLSRLYVLFKQMQATAPGTRMADFDAIQADGSVVKFSSFFDGKNYLLVDFWASWCPPCRGAIPFIRNVYEKYGDKGLRVLGVATRDKAEDNARAIQELGITWETIYDRDNTGATTYGVQGIPHMMLLSPEGTILERGIEVLDLEKTIQKHLD